MSTTRLEVLKSVRVKLNDLRLGDAALSGERLEGIIESHMHLIGGRVGFPTLWTTLALVANDDEYTIPTLQFDSVILIKRRADNELLRRVTLDYLEALRVAPTTTLGPPELYALWPDASNLINIRFWPTPQAVDTLDIAYTSLPVALTLDASVIPFDRHLVTALEASVCIEAFAGLADDLKAKIKTTGKELLRVWANQVEEGVRLTRLRMHGAKAANGIVRRWV